MNANLNSKNERLFPYKRIDHRNVTTKWKLLQSKLQPNDVFFSLSFTPIKKPIKDCKLTHLMKPAFDTWYMNIFLRMYDSLFRNNWGMVDEFFFIDTF